MPRAEVAAENSKRNVLLKTLQFIRTHIPDIPPDRVLDIIPDQQKYFNASYDKLHASNTGEWSLGIGPLEVPIEDEKLQKHRPTLLISGIICGRSGDITHISLKICITFISEPVTEGQEGRLNITSCCIMDKDKLKRIVRRFHFDYQPNDKGKPESHLQYGGKVNDEIVCKDWHYCLEHFLEQPRIHYPPVDLALLLDFIIREFETPLSRWKTEKDWRGIIFESQELWYGDYFKKATRHLNCGLNYTREKPGKHTFHERTYGESFEP